MPTVYAIDIARIIVRLSPIAITTIPPSPLGCDDYRGSKFSILPKVLY
jgi:hypothetical protein